MIPTLEEAVVTATMVELVAGKEYLGHSATSLERSAVVVTTDYEVRLMSS